MLESIILGAHLYTTHLTNPSQYNHETIGAYLSVDEFSVGSLRNCLGHRSNYLVYTPREFHPLSLDYSIGGITGYSHSIRPMILVSKKWEGWRFTLVPPPNPKTSAAISISYEWRLK